jgi:hypothetical protein
LQRLKYFFAFPVFRIKFGYFCHYKIFNFKDNPIKLNYE